MNKELGQASIFIELEDGIVTVYHGTDKVELYKTVAPVGYWDKLWETIRNGAVS